MYKKKPTKRPFYSEANDKDKRSYDILDELVRSTERVDSHPLQHSAKEYREALEVLGDAYRRSPHMFYDSSGGKLIL